MLIIREKDVTQKMADIFDRLMSGVDKPIYVLGRNKYSKRVAQTVKVEAFIDDFTSELTYLERPIIRMASVPRSSIVVSCVVDTVPITAWDRLKLAGVTEAIDYFTLSRLAPNIFGQFEFCGENRTDILEREVFYREIYDLLADDASKQHFAKVVAFRLNLDIELMRGFSLAIDRQYFEPFLPTPPGQVFVDGGGYDGETTRRFAAWNPDYRQIHFFEPLPKMMETSRRNLADMRDINFVQKGLFRCSERLRFEAGAGPASSLSSSGQIEIDVVSIDEEIQQPISFLKLDIEGAECEALLGAAEHIRKETPVIAACIYHNQNDFWRVPRTVLAINDRYNLYVRHYTESIRETVMFFVPK